MSKRDWKIVAATLTGVGAILSVLDKIFAPNYLLMASSPEYPGVLRFIGWLFLLIPPLIYIALDWKSLFPQKTLDKKNHRRDHQWVDREINMDEKSKQYLSTAVASCILITAIIHPSGEEPHIHTDQYEYLNRLNYTQYSVVVSGTSTGAPLPDNIKDLGSSFMNPDEKLFGINLPKPDDSSS